MLSTTITSTLRTANILPSKIVTELCLDDASVALQDRTEPFKSPRQRFYHCYGYQGSIKSIKRSHYYIYITFLFLFSAISRCADCTSLQEYTLIIKDLVSAKIKSQSCVACLVNIRPNGSITIFSCDL